MRDRQVLLRAYAAVRETECSVFVFVSHGCTSSHRTGSIERCALAARSINEQLERLEGGPTADRQKVRAARTLFAAAHVPLQTDFSGPLSYACFVRSHQKQIKQKLQADFMKLRSDFQHISTLAKQRLAQATQASKTNASATASTRGGRFDAEDEERSLLNDAVARYAAWADA